MAHFLQKRSQFFDWMRTYGKAFSLLSPLFLHLGFLAIFAFFSLALLRFFSQCESDGNPMPMKSFKSQAWSRDNSGPYLTIHGWPPKPHAFGFRQRSLHLCPRLWECAVFQIIGSMSLMCKMRFWLRPPPPPNKKKPHENWEPHVGEKNLCVWLRSHWASGRGGKPTISGP